MKLIVILTTLVALQAVNADQILQVYEELKVYSKKSKKSPVLKVLKDGDKITVIPSKYKKVYKVESKEGKIGYIFKKDMDLSELVRGGDAVMERGTHAVGLALNGLLPHQTLKTVPTTSGTEYEVTTEGSLSTQFELSYWYRIRERWNVKLSLSTKPYKMTQTAVNKAASGSLSKTVTSLNQRIIYGSLALGKEFNHSVFYMGAGAGKAQSTNITVTEGVELDTNDETLPTFVSGFMLYEYYMNSFLLAQVKGEAVFTTDPFIFDVSFGASAFHRF